MYQKFKSESISTSTRNTVSKTTSFYFWIDNFESQSILGVVKTHLTATELINSPRQKMPNNKAFVILSERSIRRSISSHSGTSSRWPMTTTSCVILHKSLNTAQQPGILVTGDHYGHKRTSNVICLALQHDHGCPRFSNPTADVSNRHTLPYEISLLEPFHMMGTRKLNR